MAHVGTLSENARKRWGEAMTSSHQKNAKVARVINVNEAGSLGEVSAVTLSKKLTEGLQTALCLGRSYRNSCNEAEVHRGRFKAQGVDADALAESTQFRLKLIKEHIKRAGWATDEQKERLNALWKDLFRCKTNQQMAIDNRKLLEDDLNTQRDAWRDAWFKVDKMFDRILTEAGLLRQYPVPGNVQDSRVSMTIRKRKREKEDLEHEQASNDGSTDSDRLRKRSGIAVDILMKQQATKRAKARYRNYRENFDQELRKRGPKTVNNAEPGKLVSVEARNDEARIRDDFRRHVWMNRVQKLGWAMEQDQGKLKSAQIRAMKLHPELESSLSIRSSYFDTSESGVWLSEGSRRSGNVMEFIQNWRELTAKAENQIIESYPPNRKDGEIVDNEESHERYPLRPQDSVSQRLGVYRRAPNKDDSDFGPRDSDDAGRALLPIRRSELRPSEVGLSPRKGFQRVATMQKSARKSREQNSLASFRDTPQSDVRRHSHDENSRHSLPVNQPSMNNQVDSHGRNPGEHTSQQNRDLRTASSPRGSAERSREYRRRQREYIKSGRICQLSDRGARRSRSTSTRDDIRERSHESHAREGRRVPTSRRHAESIVPNERGREIRGQRGERLTAIEIMRKGSRRP